jgi:glutathionyl-hydroquinone reductase
MTAPTSLTDTSQSDPRLLKTEPAGYFKRQVSSFRDIISEGDKFAPEEGRYRLYVSLGCPWATRTMIVRSLMGLEDIIPAIIVSVRISNSYCFNAGPRRFLQPRMDEHGWPFAKVDPFQGPPAADDDPLYGAEHIKDLYLRAQPDF